MSKRAPNRTVKTAPVAEPVKVDPPKPRFVEVEGALQSDDLGDRRYPHAAYHLTLEWAYLEHHLSSELEIGLDLDPDFQRGHVWTDAQRVAYVEHILCGGESGRRLLVAHVGRYQGDYRHRKDGSIYLQDYSLVDGKQRLNAVRSFLRGEFRVFAGLKGRPEGWLYAELGRSFHRYTNAIFDWDLVVVQSRADLLKLYLRFNAGGTPHAPEEIERVRAMLAAESPTSPVSTP